MCNIVGADVNALDITADIDGDAYVVDAIVARDADHAIDDVAGDVGADDCGDGDAAMVDVAAADDDAVAGAGDDVDDVAGGVAGSGYVELITWICSSSPRNFMLCTYRQTPLLILC